MSLFEFDEKNCQINPNNFLILTQKISKKKLNINPSPELSVESFQSNGSHFQENDKAKQEDEDDENMKFKNPYDTGDYDLTYRTLSEVVEDPRENEVNSFSINNQSLLKQSIQPSKDFHMEMKIEDKMSYGDGGAGNNVDIESYECSNEDD